ncbi:MAG: LytTR family DNA-binding domain-containing protein [Gemmatimonadaceae bacterium]
MRCLIVEDEPLALERLKGYVQQLPLLKLVASFDNAPDALSYLLTDAVDLIFLDINLGGMSGIELLETNAVKAQVILTTAHSEHALRGFELKVADYLLKPFTFSRFVQSVERAQSAASSTTSSNERNWFFLKTETRLERIRVSDLLYIEGDGDYRLVHTLTKRINTLETFAELEQRIPGAQVCRVHKSYMVAIAKIETVERDRILIRDKYIPISATYRDKFYALIGRDIA